MRRRLFHSIKDKYVSLNRKILFSALLCNLFITIVIVLIGVPLLADDMAEEFTATFLARGATLVQSSSLALTNLVEENAFTAVQELIFSAVRENGFITYGIYMDSEGVIWAHSRQDNLTENVREWQALADEMSQWAAALTTTEHRYFPANFSQESYQLEIATPVNGKFGPLGVVRYGLDLSESLTKIEQIKMQFYQFAAIYLALITVLCILLILMANKRNAKAAGSIIEPLNQLIAATQEISTGHYRKSIKISSNDEVGLLAEDMEHMRAMIEQNTETLETKVKERTQALEAAQKQAIDNAHRAGMADIATGTLHNVGNVLNSVMTSTHYLHEQLQLSKIQGLTEANTLLASHIEQLDSFIKHDPNGKALMQYYLQLGPEIQQEHQQLQAHVDRLIAKVEAISDAIRAQQIYAGSSASIIEPTNLYQMVEDARTMTKDRLQQQNVSMTLEVDPEYMILADKNKVSQILINLIANALDAMTSENTDKNHISVTAQCTESCIRLCVTDTGCGIDKADLTRIFNNGFSTKSTGHGFGLHSSANYMTEMKGSMLAESDGEGCGATFILTFQRPHATTDGAISQENSV